MYVFVCVCVCVCVSVCVWHQRGLLLLSSRPARPERRRLAAAEAAAAHVLLKLAWLGLAAAIKVH